MILCVRMAIVFMIAGYAWQLYHYGSAMNGVLFLHMDLSESVTGYIDMAVLLILSVCAVRMLYRVRAFYFFPIIIWCLADSIFVLINGADAFASIAPFSHAVRWGAPVGLWWILKSNDGLEPGLWVWRITIGTTFAAHGLEALWHHPVFIDYLISAGDRLLDVEVAESTAAYFLSVIGVMDLFLAAQIILRRWRWVVLYMGLWGLITASGRMVHFGLDAWFEVTLRLVHVGVPLALFICWSKQYSNASGFYTVKD